MHNLTFSFNKYNEAIDATPLKCMPPQYSVSTFVETHKNYNWNRNADDGRL